MVKVVVIGGGFAGSTIARKLERAFDVTLIDSKNYFEFTPGILRTIVEPNHLSKVEVLHNRYLRRARVIVGDVTGVSASAVFIGKQAITYDYLAICSGSTYTVPIKEQHVVLATRARHLRDCYEQLCKARKVLIIGGGLVGVELAAEIATHYTDKEITIVHATGRIIERNQIRSSRYASEFLKKHGVRIVYNEFVERSKHRTFITNKRQVFEADIAFLCTGIQPNFSFLKHHFRTMLNEKNQIKVNEFLQVVGTRSILAAGDITDIALEKTAQNAEKQGSVVAANIHALHRKQPLHPYISRKTPMVISLGKNSGILEHNGLVLTGLAPGILKNLIELKEMWKRGKF